MCFVFLFFCFSVCSCDLGFIYLTHRISFVVQDISQAYEVLRDPRKRSQYDQFGEEGIKGNIFISCVFLSC
jgi:hypothetical protein